MFISRAIQFNTEGPSRGLEFVTRKITSAAARIAAGLQDRLELGNVHAYRDWTDARDMVRAHLLMLQQDTPDTFVLASGKARSVKDFCNIAFESISPMLKLVWEGEGIDEVAKIKATGRTVISINHNFYRPAEVNFLMGDASKAKKVLGWEPEISFSQMVQDMVKNDMKLAKQEKGIK